jgi:hypothetical protein
MTNTYKPHIERMAQTLAEVRKSGRSGVNRNGLAMRCGVGAFHMAFLLRTLRQAGSVVVRWRNVSARWYVPDMAPPVDESPAIAMEERAKPTRSPRAKKSIDDEPDDDLVTSPVSRSWVKAGEWCAEPPASPAWVFQK